MRYVLDFGSLNAGGSPAWNTYKRLDTLANLAQPTITEIGNGLYYFEVDWSTSLATSITYKVTLNGVELSDVISSPGLETQGAAAASAGVSSLTGYSTVGPLVARAAVKAGLLGLSRAQVAAYDPFAQTDPSIYRLLELLDELGMDLASEVKAGLHREFTLTTAASATSYALPADYVEMVDDTGWDRSGDFPLLGPVTPQYEQYLKAWNQTVVSRIPYRLLGNRITFPVAPSNGLTLAGAYVSRYWVQTAASGTGPDSDHVTLATDYVLFDPLLVILGIAGLFLEQKGMPDAPVVLAQYEKRLEWAKGTVGGGQVLSLNGNGSGIRFADEYNWPVSRWGT